MTKADLLALLADYPDDTPIFDGKGYDLKPAAVSTRTYDIWNSETDETPTVGIGIAIGRRF